MTSKPHENKNLAVSSVFLFLVVNFSEKFLEMSIL